MIYMPGDSRLFLVTAASVTIANLTAQDFLKQQTSIPDLVTEAEQLLNSVDLAISSADIPGDEELERLKVSWAYFGNGFGRKIDLLKHIMNHLRSEQLIEAYALLANIITMPTLRRQTLELSGIHTPLQKE